jgi:hypothetical protein
MDAECRLQRGVRQTDGCLRASATSTAAAEPHGRSVRRQLARAGPTLRCTAAAEGAAVVHLDSRGRRAEALRWKTAPSARELPPSSWRTALPRAACLWWSSATVA